MGQNTSVEDIVQDPSDAVHEVVKQAHILSEIAFLSYEDFIKSIEQLNKLTESRLDSDGKRLVFAVRKGTDSTVLWKGTVQIACIKLDPETRKVINYRLLNLNQFLRLCKTLKCQLMAAQSESEASTSTSKCDLSASTLLSNMNDDNDDVNSDSENSSTDCCICLERKPNVILPCTHSYCLPCIEQWNVNNKTCPICRETLQSTDDTWVISEAPGAVEINEEIRSTLMSLTSNQTKTD